jgi:S-adenosylmethionine:tRNA ribosyltransferase-isomerase
VRRTDFHYDLPPELIAQAPLPERSASRLLCLNGATGDIVDRQCAELPDLLRPQDLLVFNDTRVIAARLLGTKPSGGAVEVFLERALGEREARVQMRASKPIREGLIIQTSGGPVKVLGRDEDLWLIQTPSEVLAFFEAHGVTPLPPYIDREAHEGDLARYQSIFARHPGAVAAPTASLHFDEALVARLDAQGVARTSITLHVGAGTFQPVRVDDIAAHQMHAEWYEVSNEVVDAVARCRAAGGRIIAVGTTVARALESSAADGNLRAGRGDTRLFVTPGYSFHIVQALITNFHLPESTLLMLVSALAGREHVLAAYAHAVRERYRFFSYGDAMWITPR